MRADAALAAGFEAAIGLDEWAIPLLLPPAPLGADLVAIVANAHPTGSPAALPRTNTEQLLLASLADSGGATAMLLACVGIDAGHLRTRLLLASGPSLGSDVLLPALSAAAQRRSPRPATRQPRSCVRPRGRPNFYAQSHSAATELVAACSSTAAWNRGSGPRPRKRRETSSGRRRLRLRTSRLLGAGEWIGDISPSASLWRAQRSRRRPVWTRRRQVSAWLRLPHTDSVTADGAAYYSGACKLPPSG